MADNFQEAMLVYQNKQYKSSILVARSELILDEDETLAVTFTCVLCI